MKGITKILMVFSLLTLFSSGVCFGSVPLWERNDTTFRDLPMGGATGLFSLNITGTPDKIYMRRERLFWDVDETPDIVIDGIKIYAGVGTPGNCSLSVAQQQTEFFYDRLSIDPGAYSFPADAIYRRIGPNKSCLKIEIAKNRQVYSTGMINLNYDKQRGVYVSAQPSTVELRLP